MMRKYIKRRTLIITLFLVLFLLVNIVISYSYFIGKVYNNESEATLSLTSNGLKIIYQNDTPIISEDDITRGWVSTKSFSITANAQNDDISLVEPKIWYNMKLIIDENTFSDGSILYSLTNTTTDSKGLAADSFSELSIPTGSNMEGLSLGSGYVELGSNMHTYVLELKYNDSIDPEYNKRFSCHIVTEIVSNVTLNIDLDGGESSDTLERSLGKKTIVKLSTPTKPGCDFNGWELVSGDSIINSDSTVTVGTSDTKIKAKWIVRTINVHLDLNGGATTDNVDILAPQDSYIDLALPTRDGYNFEGWELLDGTAEIKGSRIMTTKTDILLYAKWNSAAKYISLVIDLNGGTSSTIEDIQTVSANSNIVLDIPTKEGFVFSNWEVIKGEASVSDNTILMGEKNTVLKAVWDAVIPIFTYLKSDGKAANYTIISDTNDNWRIKFLETGTLTFSDLGNAVNGIDVFLVGGGGGGAGTKYGGMSAAGGGGGYTTTGSNISAEIDIEYEIVVGNGGSGGNGNSSGGTGGTSFAFDLMANGGKGATTKVYGVGTFYSNGGSGGSGGGAAGDRAGNGGKNGGGGGGGCDANCNSWWTSGGSGQGTTTREFGEDAGTLYAGGGGGGGNGASNSIYNRGGLGGEGGGGTGGGYSNNAGITAGEENTGGGGGGSHANSYSPNGAAGGSGIVIIRNARS